MKKLSLKNATSMLSRKEMKAIIGGYGVPSCVDAPTCASGCSDGWYCTDCVTCSTSTKKP